jgi:hypothetical protein
MLQPFRFGEDGYDSHHSTHERGAEPDIHDGREGGIPPIEQNDKTTAPTDGRSGTSAGRISSVRSRAKSLMMALSGKSGLEGSRAITAREMPMRTNVVNNSARRRP